MIDAFDIDRIDADPPPGEMQLSCVSNEKLGFRAFVRAESEDAVRREIAAAAERFQAEQRRNTN